MGGGGGRGRGPIAKKRADVILSALVYTVYGEKYFAWFDHSVSFLQDWA